MSFGLNHPETEKCKHKKKWGRILLMPLPMGERLDWHSGECIMQLLKEVCWIIYCHLQFCSMTRSPWKSGIKLLYKYIFRIKQSFKESIMLLPEREQDGTNNKVFIKSLWSVYLYISKRCFPVCGLKAQKSFLCLHYYCMSRPTTCPHVSFWRTVS